MRLFFYISFFCLPLVYSSVVNNVRLIEPIPYMINVITETVQRLEEAEWCNLKIPDVSGDINEVVFGANVTGTVIYKNGFVVSINRLDIVQHTLGQIWRFDRIENTTTAEITGTLRMNDVTLGYDVEVTMDEEETPHIQYYTSKFVLPLISFEMKVVRDMFTEAIDVNIISTVQRTTNKITFLPANNITDILVNLYDYTTATSGVNSWSTNYLRPFALDVVENVLEYPTICYNCPIS